MTGAAIHHPAFRHAGHVAWRTIGGETVLVDLRSSIIIGLNAAGGCLWQGLEQPADAAGLAGTSGLEVDRVMAFLADLHRRGLLQEVEAPATAGVPAPATAGGAPPAVAWTEELRAAAQTCQGIPGTSQPCNVQPGS